MLRLNTNAVPINSLVSCFSSSSFKSITIGFFTSRSIKVINDGAKMAIINEMATNKFKIGFNNKGFAFH
ncbi:hypothetical protein GCM10011412_14570 [Maribacter cobaltidurans]|nr:hypothetical protein GCM10011412_14570 [Maribacter cobaltidurans]